MKQRKDPIKKASLILICTLLGITTFANTISLADTADSLTIPRNQLPGPGELSVNFTEEIPGLNVEYSGMGYVVNEQPYAYVQPWIHTYGTASDPSPHSQGIFGNFFLEEHRSTHGLYLIQYWIENFIGNQWVGPFYKAIITVGEGYTCPYQYVGRFGLYKFFNQDTTILIRHHIRIYEPSTVDTTSEDVQFHLVAEKISPVGTWFADVPPYKFDVPSVINKITKISINLNKGVISEMVAQQQIETSIQTEG